MLSLCKSGSIASDSFVYLLKNECLVEASEKKKLFFPLRNNKSSVYLIKIHIKLFFPLRNTKSGQFKSYQISKEFLSFEKKKKTIIKEKDPNLPS